MTERSQYVLDMTDSQRVAALIRLANYYPGIFDEVVRQDSEQQRALRAHLERRPGRGPDDHDECRGC